MFRGRSIILLIDAAEGDEFFNRVFNIVATEVERPVDGYFCAEVGELVDVWPGQPILPWMQPCCHLEDRAAETPDVHSASVLLAVKNLWGCPVDAPW